MQHIANKLKSTRGASMVFALLVFALCALAGTVTLVAAAANIGRYTHLVQEEQQYLSAASALDVLQDRLEGRSVQVAVKYVVTEKWHYETDGTYVPGVTTYALTDTAGAALTGLSYFQSALLDYYMPPEWKSNLAGSLPGVTPWDPATDGQTYTVTLDTSALDPALADTVEDTVYPVTVMPEPVNPANPPTIPVDVNSLALKMTLAVKTANGRDVYPLTVVWMPDVRTETDTTTETTGSDSDGKRTTTTTLTLTLRWTEDNRTVTFG